MAAQLEHLASCADMPQVTLQALPYAVGGQPGHAWVVCHPSNSRTLALVMSSTLRPKHSTLFLESDTDLERFTGIFEHLQGLLPPDESVTLIRGLARDL